MNGAALALQNSRNGVIVASTLPGAKHSMLHQANPEERETGRRERCAID